MVFRVQQPKWPRRGLLAYNVCEDCRSRTGCYGVADEDDVWVKQWYAKSNIQNGHGGVTQYKLKQKPSTVNRHNHQPIIIHVGTGIPELTIDQQTTVSGWNEYRVVGNWLTLCFHRQSSGVSFPILAEASSI